MAQLSESSAVDKGHRYVVQSPLEVRTGDEKRQHLSSTNVLGAPASPRPPRPKGPSLRC